MRVSKIHISCWRHTFAPAPLKQWRGATLGICIIAMLSVGDAPPAFGSFDLEDRWEQIPWDVLNQYYLAEKMLLNSLKQGRFKNNVNGKILVDDTERFWSDYNTLRNAHYKPRPLDLPLKNLIDRTRITRVELALVPIARPLEVELGLIPDPNKSIAVQDRWTVRERLRKKIPSAIKQFPWITSIARRASLGELRYEDVSYKRRNGVGRIIGVDASLLDNVNIKTQTLYKVMVNFGSYYFQCPWSGCSSRGLNGNLLRDLLEHTVVFRHPSTRVVGHQVYSDGVIQSSGCVMSLDRTKENHAQFAACVSLVARLPPKPIER